MGQVIETQKVPECIYRVALKDDVYTGLYDWHLSYEVLFELQGAHPGPYRDKKMAKALQEESGKTNPSDLDTIDGDRINGRYFGFTNPQQLKHWIYMEEWRRELDEDGFCIYLIEPEPDTYLEGDSQCIFNIEDVIGTMTLLEV